jgi:hypothetical protein
VLPLGKINTLARRHLKKEGWIVAARLFKSFLTAAQRVSLGWLDGRPSTLSA